MRRSLARGWPDCVSASIQTEKPTAGIGVGEPSCVIRPS